MVPRAQVTGTSLRRIKSVSADAPCLLCIVWRDGGSTEPT